jgi:hypothetical protein
VGIARPFTMILFVENKIRLGEKIENILRWEVWFHTPWGLCTTLEHAITTCQIGEIDPEQAIIPITVAVSDTMYEAYHRG